MGLASKGLPNGNKKGKGGEKPGKQRGEGSCKEQDISLGTEVDFK